MLRCYWRLLTRAALVAPLGIAALFMLLSVGSMAAAGWRNTPIVQRNMEVLRYGAAERPRREFDQELYLDWPIYRTPQGQGAFNAAMATLKASEGAPPPASAFADCGNLHCPLTLPKIGNDGWFPAGRLWVSPRDYILIVRWPRRPPAFVKRRSRRTMRYFVFHEFHNGTGNTDTFDTVSSHNRRVFVPFYLGKAMRDAGGSRFVVLIQVAPYDVRSIHASNRGSAGPGVEVAKNYGEALQSLQERAGVLLATMVKRQASKLRVVNHRGSEGRPMLRAYMERIKAVRRKGGRSRTKLPFTRARIGAIKTARAALGDLIRLPRSVQDRMLDPIFTGQHVASVSSVVAPPRPKLVRAAVIAPRPKLPREASKHAPLSAMKSSSPLTAFLKASAGAFQLLAPPKRAVPPWCAKSMPARCCRVAGNEGGTDSGDFMSSIVRVGATVVARPACRGVLPGHPQA